MGEEKQEVGNICNEAKNCGGICINSTRIIFSVAGTIQKKGGINIGAAPQAEEEIDRRIKRVDNGVMVNLFHQRLT
jgi:hypothetical protein